MKNSSPVKVSPSILNADFGHLADTIQTLESADWIHCDVMDGIFVPNISFGQPVIAAARKLTDKPLDVHLMITDPLSSLEHFAAAGADIITIHPESPGNTHLHRALTRIRSLGKKAGIALNPSTHPEVLEYIYEEIDLVLVMTVNPGYGGQAFIPAMLRKIQTIANRISALNLPIELEVDGGITIDNAQSVRSAGATVLVAGSAVINAPQPARVIKLLKGSNAD
ncbi:MAG: ribulose-phosphate 3-epimerase [Treponema sp.]|nr:ribulose-phosphate 3-epimerase [Treponema sp.]